MVAHAGIVGDKGWVGAWGKNHSATVLAVLHLL